jgi:response regulator of citrate/malate metabolism
LVLLDLNLPDGHGLTFLKKSLTILPTKTKTYRFIMTGSEDMNDVKRVSEYDVDAS